MKRATFQIEPTAKFSAGRPNTSLNALAERLFGRTRNSPAELGGPPRPPAASRPIPSGAPLRKRSAQEALKIQNSRSAAAQIELRKPPRIEDRPAPRHHKEECGQPMTRSVCEYRGFLISTARGADGGWTASFARKDQDGITLPRRFAATYLARFLAVADAELEIDELVEQAAR